MRNTLELFLDVKISAALLDVEHLREEDASRIFDFLLMFTFHRFIHFNTTFDRTNSHVKVCA